MRRQGLVSNFSILSISTVIQGALGFITVVYLARILGPNGYGLYSYTWTWAILWLTLTQLGIPTWMTRVASALQGSERIARVQEAWDVLFWLGLFGMLIFIGATLVLPMSGMTKILLVLWSSLLLQNSVNPQWIYALEQQLAIPAVAMIVGAILRLVATVLLVNAEGKLNLAVIVTVTALWIAPIGLIAYLAIYQGLRCPCWPGWRRLATTIRHSSIFAIFGVVGVIYSGIDVLILRHFTTLTQVGFYSAATRPLVLLASLLGVLLQSFYPMASQLVHDNREKLEQVTVNILRMVVIVTIPIAIGAMVVDHSFIAGLFGNQYQSASVPFAILTVSWMITAIREVFAINLVVTYGEKRYLRAVLIGAGINLLTMLGLVHWGATGLAAALACSQAFLMIYTGRLVRHQFRDINFPWRTAWLAVLNSLIMGAVVYELLPYTSVWVVIGIGIFVFTGLAFITRLLTWADLMAMKGA